jgi:hypothetical protein
MPSAKGKDKSSKPDYHTIGIDDLVQANRLGKCVSDLIAQGKSAKAAIASCKKSAREKAIKESALGALATTLSNMIGMTEDTASGFKIKRSDWELDDSMDGVEDAQNALTLAAQRAQKIVQAEVAKAQDASEEDVLAIIRRVKREVALPIHKKFREYGSMDTEAMDTLDRALANAAKSASSGLDLKSIYLSI